MANCPEEIVELLPWYANGTLEAAARADVERHLCACTACRLRVDGLRALQGALAARPQPAVLPDVEAILGRLALPPPARPTGRWAWMLLKAQARVVRRDIWAVSALVMALGTLITMLSYEPPAIAVGALPLVWAAPVVAAAGAAFFYGPAVAPAIEIELAAPVSPRLILLARLALTFGFDLLLGLAGSGALALARPGILFWPLVTTWLAPMAFLSSLAFLLTILTADPNVGFLVSLGLWAAHSTAGVLDGTRLSRLIPDLTTAAARPWLWALALLLGGMALWAGGSEERWIRERA